MADIKEFAGYRYDSEKCGEPGSVMAVPYDIMNDEDRQKFYDKNEFNIVRVSNGLEKDSDSETGNKYTRAKEYLADWIKKGILKKETKPAIYLYEQHSIYKNTVFINHGMAALLRLEDLGEDSSVKVCEETKTDFMEDRYNLLKNIKANVDMINCMYIDSERPLTHLMNEISEGKPDMEFKMKEKITGEMTENRLWVIDDEERIEFIKNSMKHTKLFITDGHNRYQAALKYMKECKEKNPNHTGEEAYNYILAFMNNAYGDSLVQLPVHRILSAKKKFSEDYFIACAQEHFKVEKIIVDVGNDELTETMKKQIETARRKNIIGIYCGGNYFYRLTLTDLDYVKSILPNHSEEYCMLDVTILNRLLLGELLNISSDNYEEYISYTRRATKGVELVEKKEAACLFVLNTVKAERICEVVDSGEKMPKRSIYIFPKAATGVVINKID